jgi:hypothetical protein
MEHSNDTAAMPLLALAWFFNVVSILNQSTISFILGTIVSILAITYYVIKIRQETKK